MPRPTITTSLANTTLELVLLPAGSRTVTKRTITAASGVAVAAVTASLTASATSTLVKAGTSLSFVAPSSPTDRQQLLITEDATLGTTAVTATIASQPTAIATNATAQFVVGALPLFGIQTFDLSNQDTTVDITNTQSGTGTEMKKVRQGKQFQISGVEFGSDQALETIVKPLSLDPAYINREVFAILTLPNGEKFEGAAMIQNYTQPGNQNEVKKYSFQLNYQGDPVWTAGYYFS